MPESLSNRRVTPPPIFARTPNIIQAGLQKRHDRWNLVRVHTAVGIERNDDISSTVNESFAQCVTFARGQPQQQVGRLFSSFFAGITTLTRAWCALEP